MADVCGGRDAYFLVARKWDEVGAHGLDVSFRGTLPVTSFL